ncbi:MAG: NAD(P)/FAD-dependent oxidoreductase [Planctomycetota bacterium]|nr:MAG: NAD(P)/FAD-dependent oxidoreductase [Planctomycetota bacterium]
MFDYRDMTIAIVGQGLAGSYMGYMLAKDRYKVRVFDSPAPSLSQMPLLILPKFYHSFLFLGVFQKRFQAYEISKIRLVAPNGKNYFVSLPHPLLVLDRQNLIHYMIHLAQEAGAKWISQNVDDLFEMEGMSLKVGDKIYEADFLIGADGKESLVRKKLLHQSSPLLEKESHSLVFSYLPNVHSQEFMIQFLPGLPGYFWSFPTQKGTWIGIRELSPYHRVQLLEFLLYEKAFSFFKVVEGSFGVNISRVSVPEAKPFEFQNYMGPNWALVGAAAGLEDPLFGFDSKECLLSAYLLCDSFAKLRPSQYPDQVRTLLEESIFPAEKLLPYLKNSSYLNTFLRASHRKEKFRQLIQGLFTGDLSYKAVESKLSSLRPSLLFHLLFSWLG